MTLEQLDQAFGLVSLERDERDEIAVHEPLVGIEQERLPAGHPGAEVAAVRPEDDDGAAGHVLARVVADALDHGHRAGVAHREALARRAGAVELAAGGAVEDRVADEARRRPRRRPGGETTIRPPDIALPT